MPDRALVRTQIQSVCEDVAVNIRMSGTGKRPVTVVPLLLRKRTIPPPSTSMGASARQPVSKRALHGSGVQAGVDENSMCSSNFMSVTAGYVRCGPMAQCAVHALVGLACRRRARATPASSPASHCKQCVALTSPLLHARGCVRPSHAR